MMQLRETYSVAFERNLQYCHSEKVTTLPFRERYNVAIENSEKLTMLILRETYNVAIERDLQCCYSKNLTMLPFRET